MNSEKDTTSTTATATINLVASAHAVERNVVGNSTRTNYINRLVEFILWLHDNHEDILSDECLNSLTSAKSSEKKAQKKSRDIIKKFLKNLDTKNCKKSPIKITPDQSGNILTYNVIAEFIETVDLSLAMEFKRSLELLAPPQDKDDDIGPMAIEPNENGEVKVAVRLEASTYDSFRSAISHLYKESGVKMPGEMVNNLSRYIKGSKRINLATKQTLGLKITEGKSHMSVPVYEMLCKIMFESEKPEHVFAHAFTVLDWNLMKRAENVVGAKIAHVYMMNDALVFLFAKSKSHQDGSEEFLGPWHVYANPHKPYLCPVLALARFLFTYPETFSGSRPLFEGSNSYSRYQKVFARLLLDHAEELRRLGVEPSDLGSHSARKGVGTLVAAGCTVAPPIVSICLRMGWALGGVLGRYFKRGDAGDMHVGRMASLINALEKEFAVCRPYFDYTKLESEQERNAVKIEIMKCIDSWLPSDATVATRMLAQELFASVCFHRNYLDEHLHKNLPFRDSPFFKDIPQAVLNAARIAYPWDATEDTPKFTGIPPHVSLLAKQESLQIELGQLRESIASMIGDELNDRGIGCTEFYTRGIENAIKDLETNLKQHYEDVIKMHGQDYDHGDIQMHHLDDALSNYDAMEEEDSVSDFLENENSKQTKKRKVTVGMVGGKFTVLPHDFEFPRMTGRQLVQNWFIGNNDRKIVPYKRLNAGHLHHVRGGAKIRQRMSRFMAVVEHYAKIEKCWIEKDAKLSDVKCMWDAVSNKYLYKIYASQEESRQFSSSWSTMLNKMVRKGAFKRSRDKCKNDDEWSRSIYNQNKNILL
jgi:hypothetical protein